MKQGSEKKFPVNANDYKLCEEVGEGVSATVYKAICVPFNETVAIKVLDLEKCNNDLDGIRREVQTMSLIDHPNLLRAHCSFISGHDLWIVMPYMAGGSCLHIMKSAYPEGFKEAVIATLLREILKALVYLHLHGLIHRDVKAGNILIDSNGTVKLADFGVSACMFDTGDRRRSRNTFVGTPCWMAPEVMHQLEGYDFKADIWSLGITALELAHGHAPFSKYPPKKVLLMILQNAPPGLDYERDKRFSKSFKELVSMCLVKDPKKRPSSEKLLKHQFFKHARSPDYLARTILDGLAPLGDRFRILKAKEADFLVKNKALHGDKDQLSQQEYVRGISAWNFNLEDLKNQAALIEDSDLSSNTESPKSSGKQSDGHNDVGSPAGKPSLERASNLDAVPHFEDGLNDIPNLENSLSSFPIKPLQALKGCFDVCEDELANGSPSSKYSVRPDSEQQSQIQSPRRSVEDREAGRDAGENLGQSSSPLAQSPIPPLKKLFSGSLQQDSVLSPKKFVGDGDRSPLPMRHQPERNYSGPLLRCRSRTKSVEDAPEIGVVQRKGRFKVTSADLSPLVPTNGFNSPFGGSSSPTTPTVASGSVLSSLQFILQQNHAEREEIIKLIKIMVQNSGNSMEFAESGSNDLSQIPIASPRERELQSQVNQLEQSVVTLDYELRRQKAKVAQLEEKLEALAKNVEKS